MKILWNDNPMRTSIVLDSSERRWLSALVRCEELEEILGDAHHALDPTERAWRVEKGFSGPRTDREVIERALFELRFNYVSGEVKYDDRSFSDRIEERAEMFAKELESGVHEGDCTCVPCSCLKCHAERLIGVNTIEGLTKHHGAAIAHRFAAGKTSADVIVALRTYVPNPTDDERLRLAHPRWVCEAREAADWLERYRAERLGFSKEDPS